MEQQPAAMQDFDPTYDRCGSKPVRLRASKCFPVCPRKRTSNRPFMSTRPDAGLATATERVVAGDKRTEIARRADQRRDGHTWRGTLETRCPSLMIHDYGQHEDRSPTHGYELTREGAWWRLRRVGGGGAQTAGRNQMTRDEAIEKCARGMLRRLGQREENWKQGRQKDLAADIVVALEALGLWKETSPT